MSTIGWPTLIIAPSSTSHDVTVPSRISSPHLGMTMAVMAVVMVPPWRCAPSPRGGAAAFAAAVRRRRPSVLPSGQRALYRRRDLRRARDVRVLQRRRERHRRMRRGDHLDRPLQRAESLLYDLRRDVGGDAAARVGLVDADQPTG